MQETCNDRTGSFVVMSAVIKVERVGYPLDKLEDLVEASLFFPIAFLLL